MRIEGDISMGTPCTLAALVLAGMLAACSLNGGEDPALAYPDGQLDDSFDPGQCPGDNEVDCIAVQADSKVLVGGNFVTVDGAARTYVARLNADGSLDGTFNEGAETGANNRVWAIALQADGRIIIAGDFTVFNRVARIK